MTMTPDPKNHPPTAQTATPGAGGPDEEGVGWLRRARAAFRSSTTYVDSNYRKSWEDGIRAFNSQHPTDSKYSQPSYDKRSRLFRPKTRSVIRKNEAAAAAAFFSNMDVVSVAAEDQSNKAQMASSEVMKQLLQYRLTKSIPWFQLLLGGFQDAQVVGVVCSHNYWDYRQRDSKEEGGEPEVYMDKPCVDLVPVENIRIDPAASWIDPINSSPYVIHMMPMYLMDVRRRIDLGEWLPVTTGQMLSATNSSGDSTRAARNKDREDPQTSETRAMDDIEIIWVQRHIHRKDDVEWEFYTLADICLLSTPRPLKEAVLHGRRPYTMGCCIIESHKVMPSGVPQLSKGLQDEANEIANQRIDNVKFALNKKWFAKRGKEVDLGGLVRNVPGGIVMMDDPEKDVREITWPDVTQSSYEEQNRINLDMDELLGNFNPAALMMGGGSQAPARNMAMLSQSNGTLVEYSIRTLVETWVQPTLRQLVLLEQHYETDEVVLALAAKNAQLFQRFGIDQVTDSLLNQELTLSVNVGMGATDPSQKLQKFLTAITSYSNIVQKPTPGMNTNEVGKEIFAHLGYQDGSRFFTVDNPQVAQLQQQLQQAGQLIQQLQGQLKEKNTGHVVSLKKTELTNQTKLQETAIKEEGANKRALAVHWNALHMQDNEHQHEVKTLGRKAKTS